MNTNTTTTTTTAATATTFASIASAAAPAANESISLEPKQVKQVEAKETKETKVTKVAKAGIKHDINVSETSRGYSLDLEVSKVSRPALGKVIPVMNREFRSKVEFCTVIVWAETPESRKNKFATGKFTAQSVDEESLHRVAKMIMDALNRHDNQFHIDQDQRQQIQQQKQIEFEQRLARREQIAARKAEEERRRQERHTLGAIIQKQAPGAPRTRKFESRADEFPSLIDKKLDFNEAETAASSSSSSSITSSWD
jgi:hypothetical protein